MHAWGEIEQRDRRKSIPAATAGALPEMSCAREAAVHAAIALRPSQDAPEALARRSIVRPTGARDRRSSARTISPRVGSSRSRSGKHRARKVLVPSPRRSPHTQARRARPARAESRRGSGVRSHPHRCRALLASHEAKPAPAASDATRQRADTTMPQAPAHSCRARCRRESARREESFVAPRAPDAIVREPPRNCPFARCSASSQ